MNRAAGARSANIEPRSGGSIAVSGPSRLTVAESPLGNAVSTRAAPAISSSQRSFQRTAHEPRSSSTPYAARMSPT